MIPPNGKLKNASSKLMFYPCFSLTEKKTYYGFKLPSPE